MTKKKHVKIKIEPSLNINRFKADQVKKADENGGVSVVTLSNMSSDDISRLITSFFGD